MKKSNTSLLLVCLLSAGLLAACGGDKSAEAEKSAPVATTDAGIVTLKTTETATPDAAAKSQLATTIDAHPGKLLHDANCISCHDASVYTRSDHKVMNFDQLSAQVRRCDANLGTGLFDEEMDQVAQYLNKAYYQFEP